MKDIKKIHSFLFLPFCFLLFLLTGLFRPLHVAASGMTFEDKIYHIRAVYYGIEDHPAAYTSSPCPENSAITFYKNADGKVCKAEIPEGTYNSAQYPGADRYMAQCYYSDEKLLFIFAFDGTEEYRYYLDPDNSNNIIRYIDNYHTTYDYENGIPAYGEYSIPSYFCYLANQLLHPQSASAPARTSLDLEGTWITRFEWALGRPSDITLTSFTFVRNANGTYTCSLRDIYGNVSEVTGDFSNIMQSPVFCPADEHGDIGYTFSIKQDGSIYMYDVDRSYQAYKLK